MKKLLYKILILIAIISAGASCRGFLDTDYTGGVDLEEAITTVSRMETALTGTYYCLINYRFAGRDVIAVGDIAADLTSHNNATTHFLNIHRYTITDSNTYLDEMWSYGYKAISQASRIIVASEDLLETATQNETISIKYMVAQSYAIRALASHYLVTLFALPHKVDADADNGSTPGIVVVTEPIPPFVSVSRSTVAQCYQAINDDIDAAISLYEEIGETPDAAYMNIAAVYGLKARVALHAQDYTGAITAATTALSLASNKLGKSGLNYTEAEYVGMFDNVNDNKENLFFAARSTTESFTANSIGTLYSNYGVRYNTKYEELFTGKPNDVRLSIMNTSANDGTQAGKYMGITISEGTNPEISNIPLIRTPEMYLIQAEAHLKKSSPDIGAAQTALLTVAMRDADITAVTDLPSDVAGLITFLEDERARELFWEGHRFSDLRRWGKEVSVSNGITSPFDIAKFCYPIPVYEINSGWGVEQTPNWSSNLPN